jgi:biotin carboxyl carrier protein
MKVFAHTQGREYEICLSPERDHLLLQVGKESIPVVLDDQKGPIRSAFIGNRLVEFGWIREEGAYRITIDGRDVEVTLRDPRSESLAKVLVVGTTLSRSLEIKAPLPGLVKRVLLQEGETVQRDQAVLHLDAMKLENEIASPRDGVLTTLSVREGQAVEKGQLLFVVG